MGESRQVLRGDTGLIFQSVRAGHRVRNCFLADLRVKLIDDTGAFFDVLPYPAAAYTERSPLMREIRLDGLDL